jgi:hypothetical protein
VRPLRGGLGAELTRIGNAAESWPGLLKIPDRCDCQALQLPGPYDDLRPGTSLLNRLRFENEDILELLNSDLVPALKRGDKALQGVAE